LIKNGPNHSHSFFDPNNELAKNIREQLAMDCLDELIDWLKMGGRVGIHGNLGNFIIYLIYYFIIIIF
jgi:hypothetical protein